MPTDHLALCPQFNRDPRAAISLPRLPMRHGDHRAQLTIPAGMRGAGGAGPRVVTAARDGERRPQHFDRIIAAHLLDPGIPLGGGSERMPAAFFKMSRCSVSRRFSRRNRSTSNCNASLLSGKPGAPAARVTWLTRFLHSSGGTH